MALGYSLVLVYAFGSILLLLFILIVAIFQIGKAKRNGKFATGLKSYVIALICYFTFCINAISFPEPFLSKFLWPIYYCLIPMSLAYWYIRFNIKSGSKRRDIATHDKIT